MTQWIKIIFEALLLFIILWLTIGQYLTLRSNYYFYYDWWNNNNGSAYKFNITQLFAEYQVPPTFYYINRYFLMSNSERLNTGQIQFLRDNILRYMYTVSTDGSVVGIITPKSFCSSVKLSSKDGDQLFNDWYVNPTTRARAQRTCQEVTTKGDSKNYKAVKSCIIEEDVSLSGYTDLMLSRQGQLKYYISYLDENSLSTNSEGNYYSGLYPDKLAYTQWRGLILEWLNGTSAWTDKTSGWVPDYRWSYELDDDNGFWTLVAPKNGELKYNDNGDTCGIFDVWFGIGDQKVRPDNFLARTGISPTATIIQAFYNDKFNYDGIKLDTAAFVDLLGSDGDTLGGWVGLVINSEATYDQLFNLINTEISVDIPKPKCKKPTTFPASMLKLKFYKDWKNWIVPVLVGAATMVSGGLGGAGAVAILSSGATTTAGLAVTNQALGGILQIGSVPPCDKYY